MMRLRPLRTICWSACRRTRGSPVFGTPQRGSLLREKQTLINFLCASAGGPLYYVGRDMKVSHKGLGIDESDWQAFTGHLDTTLANFEVPAPERAEVLSFINSTKPDILAQSPASRA